jgi:hypothetical protein
LSDKPPDESDQGNANSNTFDHRSRASGVMLDLAHHCLPVFEYRFASTYSHRDRGLGMDRALASGVIVATSILDLMRALALRTSGDGADANPSFRPSPTCLRFQARPGMLTAHSPE